MTMTTRPRTATPTYDTFGLTVGFRHPTPRGVEWECAGHPTPGLFDPSDDDELAEALQICGGCGVRELCGSLGRARAEWGVWGGQLLEKGKPLAKVRTRGRPKHPAA